MSNICNDILTELFRKHPFDVYYMTADLATRTLAKNSVMDVHTNFVVKHNNKHLYSVSIVDGRLVVHLNEYDIVDVSFDLSNPHFDVQVMRERFVELSHYLSSLKAETRLGGSSLSRILRGISTNVKRILKCNLPNYS